MSSSKVLADRMMLDIQALILSLQYTISALRSGKEGKEILEAANEDIKRIEEDYIMADNLDTYYNFSVAEQSSLFHSAIDKIGQCLYKEAQEILNTLTTRAEEKLSEHLRESVS